MVTTLVDNKAIKNKIGLSSVYVYVDICMFDWHIHTPNTQIISILYPFTSQSGLK